MSIALDFVLQTGPGSTAQFDLVIAGSCLGSSDAIQCFRRVRSGVDDLWSRKESRYEDILGRSALSIPDESIQPLQVARVERDADDLVVRRLLGRRRRRSGDSGDTIRVEATRENTLDLVHVKNARRPEPCFFLTPCHRRSPGFDRAAADRGRRLMLHTAATIVLWGPSTSRSTTCP